MLSWHFLRKGDQAKKIKHLSNLRCTHMLIVYQVVLFCDQGLQLCETEMWAGGWLSKNPGNGCWYERKSLSDMLAKHSTKLACQLRDHVCIIRGFPIQVQGIIPLSCQNCLHCGVLTCSCIRATNCVCCIVHSNPCYVSRSWRKARICIL